MSALKYVLSFHLSSQSNELCLISVALLPPQRRVGVKCFGLDEPALGKGEV